MKKPAKKSNLSLSVSDFKSWMSGVEDMQESDWVPNKVQWDRIRAKIALLADDVADKVEHNVEVSNNAPQPGANINQPAFAMPQNYQEQLMQPTYYDPQQFESPQQHANEGITYISGETAQFI